MCLVEFTELSYRIVDPLLEHPILNFLSSYFLSLGSSLLYLGRGLLPSQISCLVSVAPANLLLFC